MSKHLVIVESPAKAKTIKRYLGKDYLVLASYGHVRDLLPKTGSVEPESNFAMKYDIIEKNARHVEAIAKSLSNCDSLYLATDPDREGEAISWHIYKLMKERDLLNNKTVHRVVFHEITKNAIVHAVEHPREISMDLVNAQQARRALDYLVGFNLSPLLWKKIRRGLSAGRVQSPALRLIVEREQEIDAFKAQEYWTITAENHINEQKFNARLIAYQGQKIEQFSITHAEQAERIEKDLLACAQGVLLVSKVEKKKRKRNPPPPFITSTLQQEASRKLGFTTRRTMIIAQQLYEGIEIGNGTVGLITYMRTDSVNLGKDAIAEIRQYISKTFGENNCPEAVRIFKTKSKNAQEAHEAIRPTAAGRTPTSLKEHLSDEQFKLYQLIWKRAIACQMKHATIDTVAVDLKCGGEHCFRANGSTISDPGFLLLYGYGSDQKTKTPESDQEENLLPPMAEGDKVTLIKILTEQHFTEPPPRFSEASLVKALEEHGIGRPSTYAPIISTLQQREYVKLENKRFHPTDVGQVVTRFLTKHFDKYVDYDFTANLEDELDAVSRGEKEWVPLLDHFWKPFNHQIHDIEATVQRKDVTTEQLDKACPKCGKPLNIRLGKRGRFIGCSGYPDCDYTANLDNEPTSEAEVVEGRKCPQCGGNLVIKAGRYGKFIGCSNYPECKHIEPLEKPVDTKIECAECHKGTLLKRKSRRGKIFYSCSTYPDCQYAVWDEPINETCPQCKWPLMTLKVTKRRGEEKRCPHCKHVEPLNKETDEKSEK